MGYTKQDPDLASVDIDEIQRLIPHRHPFLMIDRMINMVPNQSAIGIKNVTIGEPLFQGHFPDQPVFPGVMVIEAMAQTSAALTAWSQNLQDTGTLVYLLGLDKTRFRRIVRPGDQVELHVHVQRGGGKIWRMHGDARVDGELAAEADFMAMMNRPEQDS